MPFLNNEISKKNSFIAEITTNISSYRAEKKAALEAKKIINTKIEKLLTQREAAEERIDLAGKAIDALGGVIKELNIPYLRTCEGEDEKE